MKRAFYISCALNGTLAGILLVCGGVSRTMWVRTETRSVGNRRPENTRPAHLARAQAIYTALSLLWAAESSNGTQMVGDGGAALGHFQQHRAHWEAGTRVLGVSWAYPEDTNNLARSAAVAAANWARYAPDAIKSGDVEMLVRKHRLPNKPMRADNDAYVERVMR